MDEKKLKKLIISGIVLFVLGIVIANSFSIVSPTERAIKVTMGKPSQEIQLPGVHLKAPFVQKLSKLDMTPMQYESGFSTGADGAISNDQQTIGCQFSFIWKYSEDGVYEILTSYSNREVLKQSVSDLLKEAIKTELGQYEVQDISKSQDKIKQNVLGRLEANPQFQKIPLDVKSLAISNYNWSDEYEAKVQETMNKKQEVAKAIQDVALTEQNAQKKVKEQEAEKQRRILEAEAKLVEAQKESEAVETRAKGNAAARKALADAELYEAQQIAKAAEMKRAQWAHEEKMKELENWNGKKVSDVMVMTPSGTLTTVNGK